MWLTLLSEEIIELIVSADRIIRDAEVLHVIEKFRMSIIFKNGHTDFPHLLRASRLRLDLGSGTKKLSANCIGLLVSKKNE